MNVRSRRRHGRWRAGRWRDERGVAGMIVLFPIFAAVTFMLVQAIFWQNDRQIAAAAADRASAAVALYGSSEGEAAQIATERMAAAGMRNIEVSVQRGELETVVAVSATAPGLLSGMSITVTARAVTSTERWQDL